MILENPPTQDFYHLGLSVKTERGKTNHSSEPANDAIEKTVGQLFRGMNGLIETFSKNPNLLGSTKVRFLVPVIFTTANLYISSANLSAVDAKTGNLDPSEVKSEEVPYLLYQYHVSPGIKFAQPTSAEIDALPKMLLTEYVRTVIIVNAKSFEKFLNVFQARRLSTSNVVW